MIRKIFKNYLDWMGFVFMHKNNPICLTSYNYHYKMPRINKISLRTMKSFENGRNGKLLRTLYNISFDNV